MEIIQMNPAELIPYERNAKIHDSEQIHNVATSIRKYGFKQPIVIDKENVIIIGHCRHLAAQELGLKSVPVVIADDLTEQQVAELRVVDNKSAESEWDFQSLGADFENIDLSDFTFDFEFPENWFETRTRNDNERNEYESKEYQDFVDKFKPKKTTDDCYTPDIVYDVVADYVETRYNLKKKNFVRPFYPGGDYKNEKYKADSVVVDNPPFSILNEIVGFYADKGIKFFLFCPALTPFSSNVVKNACVICLKFRAVYENGANVATSFVTNLEKDTLCRSDSDFFKKLKNANEKYKKGTTKKFPKYSYPNEVLTASMVSYMSEYGVDFSVKRNECHYIVGLESQKEEDKLIFGGGFLLSEKAAAEKAAAEKAAAEKAAAEKAAAEKAAAEKAAAEKAAATVWKLSDKELGIIKALSKRGC